VNRKTEDQIGEVRELKVSPGGVRFFGPLPEAFGESARQQVWLKDEVSAFEAVTSAMRNEPDRWRRAISDHRARQARVEAKAKTVERALPEMGYGKLLGEYNHDTFENVQRVIDQMGKQS
jgi:hypothetical protein